MKKLISMLLIAVMILSLAACSGGTGTSESSQGSESTSSESSASEESTSPEEDDPILTGEKPELKILAMYQAYNYEEQPSYKVIEELTGYKTKWYALPAENSDQKLLLEISSGADYDILFRTSLTGYAQLSSQNALIDLKPILDKYGSNIYEQIGDLAWASVTNDQGVINGIPFENMVASKENPYGMLTGGIGVRSDALEEMGAELPTNLEDFTAFLEAAKEKYGVAPMTMSSTGFFCSAIMAAFNMGEASWYDIDGTYTHRIKNPNLVDYLAYMQDLYSRGLLDNDMPINTADNAKEKFASNNAISMAGLYFWDIPAMLSALQTSNPDCKIEFVTDMSIDADTQPVHYVKIGTSGVNCISQNSKNPEHAINWLNILSEPDNFRRVYIGEEGVSYEVIDGNYWPIFEGDDSVNFNAYTNADKFAGHCEPDLAYQMWQARARKTPEMAEAYEAMNARCDEYNVEISIETYGTISSEVQKYITALEQDFSDAFLKAIVEGTDPETAIAAMQETWDANGGLEVEAAMQAFYEENKALTE